MSVKIYYRGDFGNHAFQYCSAFIYCKKHCLKLITEPSRYLLAIIEINNNDNNDSNENSDIKNLPNKIINSGNYDNNNEIIYYGKKNYLFKDYFQNAEYINNNYTYLFNSWHEFVN